MTVRVCSPATAAVYMKSYCKASKSLRSFKVSDIYLFENSARDFSLNAMAPPPPPLAGVGEIPYVSRGERGSGAIWDNVLSKQGTYPTDSISLTRRLLVKKYKPICPYSYLAKYCN